MKIEIDTDVLKEKGLSPSEYVILYLISQGITDFQNETLINSLINKGYLVDGKSTLSFNNSNCKNWIKDWLLLWPTGIFNGYRVSGNSAEVTNRMSKFIKEHPEYDKDIIFKATENYLSEKKKNNYQFIKKNSKFIKDADGSALEAECEAVFKGEESSLKDNTKFL